MIKFVAILAICSVPCFGQTMLGEARNAAAQDALPLLPQAPAEVAVLAKEGVAREQDAILKAAREYLFRRSVAGAAGGNSRGEKIDLYDAKTGVSLDAAEAVRDMAKDDTLITEDEFGPIGPGRRERIARMAGLTDEQAKQLWPLDDPNPVSPRDLAKAAAIFQEQFERGAAGVDSQEGAASRLAPARDREKAQAYRNTVLTDAEASFACYAALGFPFPIRVGKLQSPPPNGFVVFNPQLLRLDVTKDVFKPRTITYCWMEGKTEVLAGQVEVTTYQHLPRPTAPVTHVMISADDDVMAYALVGRTPPATLWETRTTLLRDVVDLYSHLRVTPKLYGLRWSLMPGIANITDNPQTKGKLREIMEDLGFIQAGGRIPQIGSGPQVAFNGGEE